MNKVECFKIRLLSFENEADIFNINKGKPIYEIGCLRPWLSFNPKQIEADPFLFVKNDTLFLFYEHKAFLDKGVLRMVCSKDLKTWTNPVTVLEEPFHLSFPWVFERDGQVYMIPESEEKRRIGLYKATNDQLTQFEFTKTVLEDSDDSFISFCDTTIIEKEGTFYLFTTRQIVDHINTLELYCSQSIMGPFVPHPLSPIAKNSKLGRNAGSILEVNGKLIRFAQDCTHHYGDNVHLCEVECLTPTEYRETLLKENIIPESIPYYKNGGHQYNIVKFRNKWIVATDAKEYHSMKANKLVRKLLYLFRK